MFLRRIGGVFGLNSQIFEEIEHAPDATMQAVIVVVVVALLSAAGSGLSALFIDDGGFLAEFLGTLIWTFIGWFLWSVATYFVGTALFGGVATTEEMLRVIGFAYAPQVLGIIPCIGPIIGLLWSLAAGFVAVRQGLDLDNVKTLVTVLVGFVIVAIGWVIITLIF